MCSACQLSAPVLFFSARSFVLLMDPILGSGTSAARAIQVRPPARLPAIRGACRLLQGRPSGARNWFRPRLLSGTHRDCSKPDSPCLGPLQVLLEKGVDEGKILFLTVIAAPEGIRRICGTYPRIKVCARGAGLQRPECRRRAPAPAWLSGSSFALVPQVNFSFNHPSTHATLFHPRCAGADQRD